MKSLLVTLLAVQACQGPVEDNADVPPRAEVRDLSQVVPSPGLPPEINVQDGNNNLDVTWHEGRLYLAWRSAPTHFASDQAQMHVISTIDEEDWRFEGTFSLDRDVREPQLVSTDDGLWLYFAVLGTDLFDFEPGGVKRAKQIAPGSWTEPEDFGDDGLIVWRIKQMNGRWHMFGYVGGENVYDADGEPIQIHWYTSDDALTWAPAAGEDPVVLVGGGSEADAEFLADGSLVAVVRNEAGDEDGFGSKVCTAPADDLGTWTCSVDPRKYDSPLMLTANGKVWLVARRHLANDGVYDISDASTPLSDRYYANQGAYWQAPKRCALWSVDPSTRSVAFVADLPSNGDTCFPQAVPTDDPNAWLIYNYSNDPDAADLQWIEGQVAQTGIYRQIVSFE